MHSTVIIVESMSATISCLRRARARLDDDVVAERPSSARARRRGRARSRFGGLARRRSSPAPPARTRRRQPVARGGDIPLGKRPRAISVAVNTVRLTKVALIAGPTASGKSALALALAERIGGVVINADAQPGLSRPAHPDRPAVAGGRGARAAPAVRPCRRRRRQL